MMMAKEGRVGKAAVADWPGLLHRLCPPDFWQRWDNGNPATAMSHLGGGIYYYEQVVDPGDHWYKAVLTGSWDAIGADARSVNADSSAFNTDETANLAQLWVDARTGTAKVQVVPEPATLALLALGGLALLRRR